MITSRSIYQAADSDSELRRKLLDPSVSSAQIARDSGFGRTTVRRWRDRNLLNTSPAGTRADLTKDNPLVTKGSIDETSDGATVNNVVVDSPINQDWSTIFDLFNLDASQFVVVDDTVRMSTWQQSKRLDNGERDTIQLYSYSARFRRASQDEIRPEHIEAWKKAILSDAPILARTGRLSSAPGANNTYLILVSDPQLGKARTAEAVDNWKHGVLEHVAQAKRLQPDAVHVAFMGDEHEGVVNNYPSQPHTVELNFTKQLELDFDLRVWTIRKVAELGIPISASSVISNHGAWTRNGSKDPVTTHGDNSSTHVARQVEKLFDELAPFTGWNVDWTIGESDPHVIVNLSGINAYFSHMYIEKGKGASTEIRVKNAIERQISTLR